MFPQYCTQALIPDWLKPCLMALATKLIASLIYPSKRLMTDKILHFLLQIFWVHWDALAVKDQLSHDSQYRSNISVTVPWDAHRYLPLFIFWDMQIDAMCEPETHIQVYNGKKIRHIQLQHRISLKFHPMNELDATYFCCCLGHLHNVCPDCVCKQFSSAQLFKVFFCGIFCIIFCVSFLHNTILMRTVLMKTSIALGC